VPLKGLLTGGDFGVGTFSRLDGKRTVLDGKVYQALVDGSVRQGLLRFDARTALVIQLPDSAAFERFEAGSLSKRDIDQVKRHRPKTPRP
jgi:alpha-acetolactate decarboxylase